jgi:superfamily II DNA/RNA helicase
MSEHPDQKYASILTNLSILQLNPMQVEVIEKAAPNHNLMLLSPTGSGKTLAFLLALLNKLNKNEPGIQALIIAPSRELALQIETVFRNMKTGFKVSCLYGGHAVQIEKNSLSETPAVVIGTPGRLADHVGRRSFDLSTVKLVVLDEFDKSLQMGFHKELEIIFKALNGHQQHLLTSATAIDELPAFLPFTGHQTIDYLQKSAPLKLHVKLVRTESTEKPETLMRLVAGFNQEVCLVFCNHIEAVQRLSALLKKHNFEHGVFHGDLEQIDREKNLIRFRGGATTVLIATDLAARGLDIPEIRHIVHYQLPHQHDAFLHRNGRTARMHASGQAYLILANDEKLQPYMDPDMEEMTVHPQLKLPAPPDYVCLYISAGKKEKINKGDIAGLLTKKGGLQADEIGLITTLDHASYVSVKRNTLGKLMAGIKDEKLKKQKVKIEVAK